MTDEASPRPWSVHYGAEIWDANGNMVYNLNGFNRGRKDKKNAALIVDAVNERETHNRCEKRYDKDGDEMPPHCAFQSMKLDHALGQRDEAIAERDRLRDLVRKTLHAIDALYTVAAPGAIVKELIPDRACLGVPIGKIVAEARAAIGEDAK